MGTRWVHEACAQALGPAGDRQRPEHDRGVAPGQFLEPAAQVTVEPLRILVIGSLDWPRSRAIEVRDAIAAVARGHARVRLIHAGRTCPDTGHLAGVDAWAELTAQRLSYEVEHLGGDPDRHDYDTWSTEAMVAATPAVVIAFPRADDLAALEVISRAESAGLAVLTHTG